ncbi:MULTISPECIES: hypothetical protein [Rhizobium]|uniref:hypothetical protein n=1 Tax=Rhizobium TaxID=379 RepID=UPI001C92B14F|nr:MULTISPECIES: hypothetical protein [Rhizobium]MBY3081843.1 hypothetical protein [Rhizobium laguerreae]MBY3271390.1 hypothetical protein [Rhizobium laguerreae]MBY3294479.1 hypothetical protein [Rhizobium laguerreae]MBY3327351.1 hypothetical protein [Rhizobium laguerreae]MBY3495655.1 hypothetical protein [Rhizobium laguerreae]
MSPAGERPSREAVLDAFAVESEPDRSTLERYLRLYPEYATELVDLSRELSREIPEDEAPLSVADQALIDAAWSQHAKALPATASDPFAALTADDWRTVAHHLDVPRQVITALRERRVSLLSVPRRFLQNLAVAMRCSVTQLELSWGTAPLVAARSYKADGKPTAGEQVTLEKVLIDAGVPVEKRARLLVEAD